MVRRALTRQIRWYQNRCSTFKIKDCILQNRFGKFWNFDPWWPQFWPEPKNDWNDFEMIFRELSNAVFRFVLRCAGAEIDGGGGCSNASRTKYRIAKYRIAKYRKQYIERQNIEVAKYRMRKISMGQNIEIAKYRIAKYRIAKYRKCKVSKSKISKAQNIERQNIESKISKDKISKWQNIERQNIEVAKYRIQNIEVAKYRTQNIEVVKYRKQNIEVAKYRKSCRFAYEWARASRKKTWCCLSQDEAIGI